MRPRAKRCPSCKGVFNIVENYQDVEMRYLYNIETQEYEDKGPSGNTGDSFWYCYGCGKELTPEQLKDIGV